MLFDAVELVLENSPNSVREICGLRESRYVLLNQVCLGAVNFGEDRGFVETILEPSLDVDPGIVDSLDSRARCHSEWSEQVAKRAEEERNSRFNAKIVSDSARQLINQVGSICGHSLK